MLSHRRTRYPTSSLQVPLAGPLTGEVLARFVERGPGSDRADRLVHEDLGARRASGSDPENPRRWG